MRDYERVEVTSRAEWRRWLMRHHAQEDAIWLVTYKKGAADGSHVPYEAIVDEALCFGWVDSLPRSLDEQRSMRLLAPRRPGSAWSARNKARAEALIAEGRMHGSGLAKIEAARADGTWSKLDRVETLEIPEDLARALLAHTHAMDHFDRFPRSTKRAILEWIGNARQPATRARRIEETAAQAAKNLRANQPRQVGGTARQ